MPSPTFPMSSCLTCSSGRTCRFDLDILPNSPCSSHSSASSTLSESSNSTHFFISTKRNRAPRKRPNQCSAEAAALLSSIYPKLFSTTKIQRSSFHLKQLADDPFPILIPSFPISSGDAGLLLQNLPSPAMSPVQHKPTKSQYAIMNSNTDFQYQDPGSPDFDAESILDEEAEDGGIDSIMGNLSMSKENNWDCLNSSNSNSIIDPRLASLKSFGLSGGFRFCFGISSSIRGALRQSNEGEWWRSPTVAVRDIVPTLSMLPEKAVIADSKPKKKKIKKKKKKKVEDLEEAIERKFNSAVSLPEDDILKAKLGLKLNYDGVIKEWSGGSPFSGDTKFPYSAAQIIVSLADMEDTRDAAARESSMQRYKEKRRNRLFSKKIRYEVRKSNANQRPRIKGRFVRGALLQEAMAERST
ncbi:protein CHLOROPLAST IMPORT APPARATUS 2-like isoform X2 [Phalaenopsis equestris]|uniref:protein CHLOROPLAST IMPORT APPARATUS 2-like isoform X2 n=1 Tax=Phalaenopsis equestris TaxID=78828 RepID=UPI0009E28245|nr:protein CHLOROPLAST IMPORT APPARATUS 2-like isoform X2 [Phalaenopsis equestris]